MATEHTCAQVLRWIADGKTVQGKFPARWSDLDAGVILREIAGGLQKPANYRLKPEPVLQCSIIQSRGVTSVAHGAISELHTYACAAHRGHPGTFVRNMTPFPGGSVVDLSGPGWSAIVVVLEVTDE